MNKKIIKRTSVIILMLIFVMSALTLQTSAAKNPSLGSCISKMTLYNNSHNNNNRTRSVVIPIKNYNKNFSYKAKSSCNSVASVSGSVNSKTGMTITVKAISRGTSTITLSIKSGSKTVSEKRIEVTVYPKGIATPKNLKASNIGRNSAIFSWTVSSTDYISYYRIQISGNNSSWKTIGTSKTNAVRINGLASGTRYYLRVVAISSLEDGSYLNSYSSSLRIVTMN